MKRPKFKKIIENRGYRFTYRLLADFPVRSTLPQESHYSDLFYEISDQNYFSKVYIPGDMWFLQTGDLKFNEYMMKDGGRSGILLTEEGGEPITVRIRGRERIINVKGVGSEDLHNPHHLQLGGRGRKEKSVKDNLPWWAGGLSASDWNPLPEPIEQRLCLIAQGILGERPKVGPSYPRVAVAQEHRGFGRPEGAQSFKLALHELRLMELSEWKGDNLVLEGTSGLFYITPVIVIHRYPKEFEELAVQLMSIPLEDLGREFLKEAGGLWQVIRTPHHFVRYEMPQYYSTNLPYCPLEEWLFPTRKWIYENVCDNDERKARRMAENFVRGAARSAFLPLISLSKTGFWYLSQTTPIVDITFSPYGWEFMDLEGIGYWAIPDECLDDNEAIKNLLKEAVNESSAPPPYFYHHIFSLGLHPDETREFIRKVLYREPWVRDVEVEKYVIVEGEKKGIKLRLKLFY